MTLQLDTSGVIEAVYAPAALGTSLPVDLEWCDLGARAQASIERLFEAINATLPGPMKLGFVSLTAEALGQLLQMASTQFAGRTWPRSAYRAALNPEGKIYFPEPCFLPLA